MAITLGLAYSCHTHFRLNYFLLRGVSNARLSCVAATESIDDPDGFPANSLIYNQRGVEDRRVASEWKKYSSNELGITNLMIGKPTRVVLNSLKRKGFDVYLVGGCVHDLILKRTPKDFDVLTTADLKEVTKAFSWCEIVGKRFPICHVHVGDNIVEVSSFSTSARHHSVDSTMDFQQHDEKDLSRWRNCMQRDLTINGFLLWPWEPKTSMALFPILSRIGSHPRILIVLTLSECTFILPKVIIFPSLCRLMFDPYANTIYDYIGGMEDIKKS